jgi:hypothetical protein
MGAEGAVSRLYIANANKKDSGNYSCALADVAATTVSVHVLNGQSYLPSYLHLHLSTSVSCIIASSFACVFFFFLSLYLLFFKAFFLSLCFSFANKR